MFLHYFFFCVNHIIIVIVTIVRYQSTSHIFITGLEHFCLWVLGGPGSSVGGGHYIKASCEYSLQPFHFMFAHRV